MTSAASEPSSSSSCDGNTHDQEETTPEKCKADVQDHVVNSEYDDDYLYEDILGGALGEENDDLDDRVCIAKQATSTDPASTSNKSGSACGSETCAALLSYLRTTISDRDRAISELEGQMLQLRDKHAGELHKLTQENESIRKQFVLAKSQAVRLRTELRDWLRLPLNRAIVSLKKSANLKSISQIFDVVPALASSDIARSENQTEMAELEQRLKAYNSMVKAKSLKIKASVSTIESGEADSGNSCHSEGLLAETPTQQEEVADREEGEISEEEAVKAEAKSKSSTKKKRHSDKAEDLKSKKKKRSLKKKPSKEREREKDNESNPATNQPLRLPAQQPSGIWIGLLRKHVGGAWPTRKPTVFADKSDRKGLSSHKKDGSSMTDDGDRNRKRRSADVVATENTSSSFSSAKSSAVVIESKLVPAAEVAKRRNHRHERRHESVDSSSVKRSRHTSDEQNDRHKSSRDENHRRHNIAEHSSHSSQANGSSSKKERTSLSPSRSSRRSFAQKGNVDDKLRDEARRHRSRSRVDDRDGKKQTSSSSGHHSSSHRRSDRH